MRGLPLLIAATGFMVGPKVPARGGASRIQVTGLQESSSVVIFGLKKGYESVELLRAETNGPYDLYPDDFSGCTYLWAEFHGESTEGVFVWVE